MVKPNVDIQFARDSESLAPIKESGHLNHRIDIDIGVSKGASDVSSCLAKTQQNERAFNARRITPDRMITYAANLRGLVNDADKLNAAISPSFDAARASITRSIAEAEAALDKVLNIKPTPQDTAIGKRLGYMSAEDRDATTRKAFADGDKVALAGILNSHPIVSGVDPALVAVMLEEYRRTVAPNEHRALELNKKYLGYLNKAELFAMQFGARAYAGTEAYSAKAAHSRGVGKLRFRFR